MNYQSSNSHPQFGQPDLNQIFMKVDRDRSGFISASELQQALSNGTWRPFNLETVRLMMAAFGRRSSETIDFQGFQNLWKYVTDWQACFRSYDRDDSGSIDKNELKTALSRFGYNLSDSFYDILITKFDSHERGRVFFDDFIYCCIVLQNLTRQFQQADTMRTGTVQMTYENFLTMVFHSI